MPIPNARIADIINDIQATPAPQMIDMETSGAPEGSEVVAITVHVGINHTMVQDGPHGALYENLHVPVTGDAAELHAWFLHPLSDEEGQTIELISIQEDQVVEGSDEL